LKCEFDKMTGGNTFMKKCQLTEGAGESLVDIVQKCNAHKEAFDKKYAGKRLRITGGVLSKDTMLGDGWSIQFETDTEDHLTVWCKFKAKYDEQLKKVKKGDQVVMDATFKQSAFGSFDHIEMLDGDLITPSDGQRKSARQDDGEDGDVKPAGRGNRAGGANNAGGRTTASNLTQSKLDAMDFDEIMNTLGPPDESYQGTRKKNCKLAVWNSGGGKFITVSYVEPIDGVSPTIVMTKNADRLREVVENLKRITANQ